MHYVHENHQHATTTRPSRHHTYGCTEGRGVRVRLIRDECDATTTREGDASEIVGASERTRERETTADERDERDERDRTTDRTNERDRGRGGRGARDDDGC